MAQAGFLGAAPPYQPTFGDRLALVGASLRSDPRWLAAAQEQVQQRAALAQQVAQRGMLQQFMGQLGDATTPSAPPPATPADATPADPVVQRLLASAPDTPAMDAPQDAPGPNPGDSLPGDASYVQASTPPAAPAPSAPTLSPRAQALLAKGTMMGLISPEAANSVRQTLQGDHEWAQAADNSFFDKKGAGTPMSSGVKLDNGMHIGPNGVVSAAPGYAAATGQVAGATAQATEDAKAADDVIQVPTANGGAITIPRGMYLTLAKAGALGPGVGVTQGTAAKATAEAAARAAYTPDDTEDSNGVVRHGVVAQRVQGGALTPQPAGGKAPSATFSLGAPGGSAQGPSAQAKTYMAANGDALAKQANDYRTGLQAGQSRAAAIQQLMSLSDKGVGQGGLNPMGMEVGNALASLGFPVSPKLSNAQAFQGLRSILLNGATSGSGIVVRNQKEFDAFMKRIPDTDTTATGRRMMLGYLAKAQGQQNAEAQAAMNFMSHAGPAGLAGTITGRDGKPYTWDQVHTEFLNRNPVRY